MNLLNVFEIKKNNSLLFHRTKIARKLSNIVLIFCLFLTRMSCFCTVLFAFVHVHHSDNKRKQANKNNPNTRVG